MKKLNIMKLQLFETLFITDLNILFVNFNYLLSFN